MRVRGEGPTPCDFMLVAEGPGNEENIKGRPMVGKTGKELNRKLDGHHLPDREDIFITNLFRQYGGKGYQWTEEDVKNDEPELIAELKLVKPKVIITMGRWSTRWALGEVDLDDVHGIPWKVFLCRKCQHRSLTKPDSSNTLPSLIVAVGNGLEQDSQQAMEHLSLAERNRPNDTHIVLPTSIGKGRSRKTKISTTCAGTSGASTQIILRPSDLSRTPGDGAKVERTASMVIYSHQTIAGARRLPKRVGGTADSVTEKACVDGGHDYVEIVVCPMVHIAAGFHSPEFSGLVSYDLDQIAAFFDGKIQPRVLFDDPYPEPVYEEITSAFQLEAALCRLRPGQSLAIDTEGSPAKPWSVQLSYEPGRAYVIRANHTSLLRLASQTLNRVRPRIVYHNALHDIGMQRALNLALDSLEFDDTMVMAYLLQVEPKGLKPLLIRHCNMQQRSYDDLMGSTQNELAINYFTCLWDIEQVNYEERCEAAFHAEIANGRRLKVHPKLPKSDLHKAVERGLRSAEPYRLWKKWEEDRPDTCVAAIRLLDTMPEASLDHLDVADAVTYGGRDADGTGRLEPELRGRVVSMGLEGVYDLELSTYPLIDRMQQIGFKPDLDRYRSFSGELQTEIDRLQSVIESPMPNGTGIEGFNANSADQLADFLFDRLSLRGFKKTESGRWKADKKVLEALEHEHPELPVLSNIHQYKETYKLKNTFVDRIPRLVRAWPFDDRIHPAFRTTSIPTGRLAASMPFGLPKFNPLAMPKHGKHAKGFRRGIVADDGHRVCEWDLSQIELRGLAHLSQDPVMLAVFRGERRNPDGSKIDLHAALAQRIFGVAPKDQDDSKHRLPAKAINFGLPMGMTFKGLTVELRKNGLMIGEDDAQRWIDETMTLYKGVPIYQRSCINEAKQKGYIRCLDGRIRYIGGIKSWDDMTRAEAERLAFSTKIQNSAQLVMKQAEAKVWRVLQDFWKQGKYVECILQIHDALVFECTIGLEEEIKPYIEDAMTNVPKTLCVPLEVEGKFGPSFGDLVKFPKHG